MRVAAAGNGVSETYGYDDQGRRIRKTSNGVTTWYLYNGPDIVAEYEGDWQQPTAFTTHGPNTDDPIVRYTRHAAGGYDKRYYHQDAQNSVVAVTDGNGALVGAPLFDAWGNAVPGAPLGRIERYGYTGREPDASGLIYYRARYYDPTLARFTQRDPSGLAGGLNPYAYVGNDPVNYIDPSGRVRASPVSTSNETAYGGGDCLSVNNGYGDDGGETLTDAEVARGEVEFGEGAVRLAYLRCMEWDDGRTGRIAASPDPRAGSIENQLAPYMQEAMVNVMAGGALKYLAGIVGAVVGKGTMLVEALGGGEAGVAARGLPDAALVCRGGACRAENFLNGSGVTRAADGTLSGVSTQSRAGASVGELAKPFRNNQVGVTTAGDIRRAGGRVTADGHAGNPNHATVDGLTEQQLERLFSPTVRNPVPPGLRGF